MTVLIAGILLFRSEIIRFLAPSYTESYDAMGVLALSAGVAGTVWVLTLGLHITEHVRLLPVAAALSVLLNATVSILLLPWLGVNGVAIGTLLGAFTWVGLQLRRAQLLYPIPFRHGYNASMLALTGLALVASRPIEAGLGAAAASVIGRAALIVLLAAWVGSTLTRRLRGLTMSVR
jgi:O-antigen/teichoic acid export membrane protein